MDKEEKAYWGDDWNGDIDGDGLINTSDSDADSDGFADGVEIKRGTDPRDPDDKPALEIP